VNAIFAEDQVPEKEKPFIKVNYDYDYKTSSPGNNTGISPRH
jgi:hypothetical protein